MKKLYDKMICYGCEKEFVCHDRGRWKYRLYDNHKTRFFCTWKCMQEFRERKAEEKSEKSRKREGDGKKKE